jgi:hypothetical protein
MKKPPEVTDEELAAALLQMERAPLIAFKLQASGEPVMTIHADGRVTLNEDAQPTQTDALREKINDIKEAWDWWQVDTYDRCASVVEDAINAALKESK